VQGLGEVKPGRQLGCSGFSPEGRHLCPKSHVLAQRGLELPALRFRQQPGSQPEGVEHGRVIHDQLLPQFMSLNGEAEGESEQQALQPQQ